MNLKQLIYAFILMPLALLASSDQYYYNSDISSDDALKDLTSLSVFLRIPASSPSEATISKSQIAEELKKVGKVQTKAFLIDTPKGEALDVASLPSSQATMIFETTQLVDASGKVLPVTKAALTILSETQMQETKEKISSIVWSRSYYFLSNDNSKSNQAILKEFNQLISDFSTSYQQVNPSKKKEIQFYLVE